MKKVVLLSGLISLSTFTFAQDNLVEDPLSNFKTFYEVGTTIGLNRVNTNFTKFNMPQGGAFFFNSGQFLSSFDAHINYGWLFHDKQSDGSWILKTGMNILSRQADGITQTGSKLRLSTSYIQIPLEVGVRYPLNYNRVNKYYFKAVEVHIGPYLALPIAQKLDFRDQIDQPMEWGVNYVRFGLISEISFTAFNKNGHGHKFGIRANNDIQKGIVEFKNTKNGLYPFYHNIGIFYNFANLYNK